MMPMKKNRLYTKMTKKILERVGKIKKMYCSIVILGRAVLIFGSVNINFTGFHLTLTIFIILFF